MLNKELMEHIRKAQELNPSTRVVFMGDPCQLPPIGEEESESFSESENKSELVQVMRQDTGNPIQDLALYLRKEILSKNRTYPMEILSFVDNQHILHKPANRYEGEILEAFVNAEGDKDVRHVAWTNRVVDAWNDKIRDKIYGVDRAEWMKGEAIVTTAPVFDAEKNIVFTTDTLLKISAEPVEVVYKEIPCWKLLAQGFPLYLPQRNARGVYETKKKQLLAEAKEDKRKWRAFYEFMETFAQIRPAHSLTVHRAQGSTFDDVYVSYQNILSNRNMVEAKQCLYVAVTRPRSRLILV